MIFAPTACGKTALTEQFFGKSSLFSFKDKAEIISADSMAVYQKMNIGTAKADKKMLQEIPHHLVDIIPYTQQFSAADFVELGDKACNDIFSRKKIPFIVGGTGFYIRSFILGMPETPPGNAEIRLELKERIKKEGSDSLYKELGKIDEKSAKRIHPNDEYRICRALEVYYCSKRPLSSYEVPCKPREKYNFFTVILDRDRKELYSRIEERTEQMFKAGLEDEVNGLKKEGACKTDPGMSAIGYKEFFDPLLKNTEEIKAAIKHNSKRYAKKQIVFMKDIPGARHFFAEDAEGIAQYIKGAFELL